MFVACAPYGLDDAAPCPTLGAVCDVAVPAMPTVSAPTIVAPSAGLPAAVVSQVSHNNLDVVWFRGRLFFAFRTAPYHFASPKVVMYVVSTTDQVHWEFEAKLEMKTDLREPRFLSFGGKLFFYFSVLGSDPLKFEPQGVRMSRYEGPGEQEGGEEE